jgi:hypothetical protein
MKRGGGGTELQKDHVATNVFPSYKFEGGLILKDRSINFLKKG